MFGIAKFIADLFHLDISKVQRWVFWALIAVVLIAVLILAMWTKSCWSKHKLKVTQEQVEKINKANEVDRKAELEKVVTENQDVIKTVDNRTELTNADIYERQRASQQRIAEADKKIEEAKAQGHDVTGPELECLLVPDECK